MHANEHRRLVPDVLRVLGIDLGSKRIGVAVSDSSGKVAGPLTVVQRSGSLKRDHDVIAKLVVEEEAVAIVVGLPLNMNGSEGPAAKAARSEANRIATVVGVPVHLHDERRTTVEADRVLKEANLNAQKRRTVVDKVAATVLLQSWLDSQRDDLS